MSYQRFFELVHPYLADAKPDAPYCNCRISVGWTEVEGQTKERESPGVYEQQIIEFLLRDPGDFDSPENNFTIIVGGIGTGKTTTLTRQFDAAFRRAKTCTAARYSPSNTCSQQPQFIHLDFRGWEDEQYGKDEAARQSSFWTYAANVISQANTAPLNESEEVRSFWPWLLLQRKLYEKNLTISKFLFTEGDQIRALVANEGTALQPLGEVERAFTLSRRAFIASLGAQDFAWYQVFLLAHRNSLELPQCTCSYLFIDNVDGLNVDMQKQLAGLALRLCGILRARTIICLRPLTWKHTQAEYLVDSKEHFSPPWNQVVTTRLDQLEAERSAQVADVRDAMTSLRKALTNDYSRLTQMISATSGVSIRYVLRNVYNFLESPLVARAFSRPEFIQSLSVSELARAYFCGRRDEMISSAFENLYYCDGTRSPGTLLIKPRILDLLRRKQNGTVSCRFIYETGQKFGYGVEPINAALRELAVRTRPLIWSEDGYDSFDAASNGRVMLTPIGQGYIQTLFGELYYEEVSLGRTKSGPIKPVDVLEHHRCLVETEFSEILHAVKNWGARYYIGLYGADHCLSLVHWQRLHVGIASIKDSYAVELEFDEGRSSWISLQLKDMLTE